MIGQRDRLAAYVLSYLANEKRWKFLSRCSNRVSRVMVTVIRLTLRHRDGMLNVRPKMSTSKDVTGQMVRLAFRRTCRKSNHWRGRSVCTLQSHVAGGLDRPAAVNSGHSPSSVHASVVGRSDGHNEFITVLVIESPAAASSTCLPTYRPSHL